MFLHSLCYFCNTDRVHLAGKQESTGCRCWCAHVPVKRKQMQLASIIDLLGRGLVITVSYNAYCAISKEGDNDIWTVRPQGVVPLLPWCSQIDVRSTVNALLGDTFSRENNTHGSRFNDRDAQFASRILGAMTQSCYIGTRDIRSRVIRGPYCIYMIYLKWDLYMIPWNGGTLVAGAALFFISVHISSQLLKHMLINPGFIISTLDWTVYNSIGMDMNWYHKEWWPKLPWHTKFLQSFMMKQIGKTWQSWVMPIHLLTVICL